MEPVTSTTFMKKSLCSSDCEKALSVARDTLLNRLFLGQYEERRYVGHLNEYRDVVTLSASEIELISDVDRIKPSLVKSCGAKWVGITGPECNGAPSGHCFWVKLTNIPFGQFWFQIKQIKCENGEVILRLKCIRPVRRDDFGETSKYCSPLGDAKKKHAEKSADYSFDFDPAKKLRLVHDCLNDSIRQVKPHLTWNNFILVSKFIIALGFLLVSALIKSVNQIGNYILRLIRELAYVLYVVSPVIVQAIDCLTKTIGGFFILVALIFRARGSQQLISEFQPSKNAPIKNTMQVSKFPAMSQMQIVSAVKKSELVVPQNWRERNRNLKQQLSS